MKKTKIYTVQVGMIAWARNYVSIFEWLSSKFVYFVSTVHAVRALKTDLDSKPKKSLFCLSWQIKQTGR